MQESLPIFVTQRQAARLVGISYSTMKKCFMDPMKRPANLPGPPEHRRRGRSVHIFSALLAEWAAGFGLQSAPARKRTGRRTKLEAVRDRDVAATVAAMTA